MVMEHTELRITGLDITRPGALEQIRSYFRDDRDIGAYALAYMNPLRINRGDFYQKFLDSSTYYFCSSGKRAGMVVLTKASNPLLQVFGAPTLIKSALKRIPVAKARYLATASPHHEEVLSQSYRLDNILRMSRMSLTPEHFIEGTYNFNDIELVRLHGKQIHDINNLYRESDGPYKYSSNAIDHGVYWGVRNRGQLVSISGTHVVSTVERIGIVGNVFTKHEFRSRGFAQMATSAVTRSLIDMGCHDVVLSVDPNNGPAVNAYKKLGFNLKSSIIESRLRSRPKFKVAQTLNRLGLNRWI